MLYVIEAPAPVRADPSAGRSKAPPAAPQLPHLTKLPFRLPSDVWFYLLKPFNLILGLVSYLLSTLCGPSYTGAHGFVHTSKRGPSGRKPKHRTCPPIPFGKNEYMANDQIHNHFS